MEASTQGSSLRPIRLLVRTGVAVLAACHALPAQSPDVRTRMESVLRYAGVERPVPDDVSRMAQLWTRAQQDGLTSAERQLAFRELFVAYSKLKGRDVTGKPEVLDGNARFAASIFEGGGRMDLTLPEPRGELAGKYVHVETRGNGRTPLLLISDLGVDGRKLYASFAQRQDTVYAMHIVTLPYAGAARPLPWPRTLDFTARVWIDQIERELLELVSQPRMRGVTVVGTAAGGYFAARLALLRPSQVRAVVLVNALVKVPLRAPDNPAAPASLADRLSLVKSIPPAPQLWPFAPIPQSAELRRLIEDPASKHPSVQNWMAFAVKDTAVSRQWTFNALSGGFFVPSNQYQWEMTTTDLTEGLRDLAVPTLAIASRHDKASPMTTFPAVTQWEEMKGLYPHIRLTVLILDETRHYVSADAPREFDRALAEFLARRR